MGGRLAAVGAERLEVGGEEDGGRARAAGAGEAHDVGAQLGAELDGDAALPQGLGVGGGGAVQGEVDGDGGAVQAVAPVGLQLPRLLLRPRGAGGDVLGEVGGLGAGDGSVLVGGEQVGQQDGGGLAVDDEVVDDQQQRVVLGAVPQEQGAQDAVALQVELAAGGVEQGGAVRARRAVGQGAVRRSRAGARSGVSSSSGRSPSSTTRAESMGWRLTSRPSASSSASASSGPRRSRASGTL
ncbi:hypothetical protein GCM10020000_76480 [Streptomyces olivoverticillatus]